MRVKAPSCTWRCFDAFLLRGLISLRYFPWVPLLATLFTATLPIRPKINPILLWCGPRRHFAPNSVLQTLKRSRHTKHGIPNMIWSVRTSSLESGQVLQHQSFSLRQSCKWNSILSTFHSLWLKDVMSQGEITGFFERHGHVSTAYMASVIGRARFQPTFGWGTNILITASHFLCRKAYYTLMRDSITLTNSYLVLVIGWKLFNGLGPYLMYSVMRSCNYNQLKRTHPRDIHLLDVFLVSHFLFPSNEAWLSIGKTNGKKTDTNVYRSSTWADVFYRRT